MANYSNNIAAFCSYGIFAEAVLPANNIVLAGETFSIGEQDFTGTWDGTSTSTTINTTTIYQDSISVTIVENDTISILL